MERCQIRLPRRFFHRSHVNPLFWKLHGWVDDRIEHWFNAHEDIHPGEIERLEVHAVPWFKKGKWVEVADPFFWPEHSHQGHHNNEEQEIKDMEEVMNIIEKILRPPTSARTLVSSRQGLFRLNFMSDILPDE